MKHEVPFRIIVNKPLPGVAMLVQRGKDEVLAPISVSSTAIVFEFTISVDVADELNFLGKYAQGPKQARFVYVNSGTYAGQENTCWSRRAKLSLMSITRDQIEEAIKENWLIETRFPGIGKDGGPTCASVKGFEWRVVKS